MKAMTDLIERLRTERSVYDAELADEAADEIERLRKGLDACAVSNEQYEQANNALSAEIERLQERFDYAVKKNGEQWAEIERLRAALKRIAKGCDLSNEAQAIAREALKDD